jgi:CRISPR-associated protein Cas5/CasD subtype I-E
MAVRVDSPGFRWWDYHTLGARMQMRIAGGEGKTKPGAMLTRREYLCDASFLVVLQGAPDMIAELRAAMESPQWALYLGRKCCPPSRPILEHPVGNYPDMLSALRAIPWRPRFRGDNAPQAIECLLDWLPTSEQPEAPDDALVWYDVPLTFDPPSHNPRFVIRITLGVGRDRAIQIAGNPAQSFAPPPPRTRANYRNSKYRNARAARLDSDQHLCIFCKSPATTVQHITYRRAGGNETLEDLRSLCRLCHDAITMIEYGLGMGMDRINPEEPHWRDRIIAKRKEIIRFRSLETRRRRLAAEEVQ